MITSETGYCATMWYCLFWVFLNNCSAQTLIECLTLTEGGVRKLVTWYAIIPRHWYRVQRWDYAQPQLWECFHSHGWIVRYFQATNNPRPQTLLGLGLGLGLGWVVEDDLTDDVLKKSLSSKWLQGLGFLQVLPLFRFYSSSGQLETLIFKHTEARA